MTEEHDRRQTPSQAEGDRETVERDLEEKFGSKQQGGSQPQQKPDRAGGDTLSTPSQAEGERDNVVRDLNKKS